MDSLQTLDHWMMLVAFGAECLAGAALWLVSAIFLIPNRAKIPPRFRLFYALIAVGIPLSALADYWLAFGAPAGHPALPTLVQLAGLAFVCTGLWLTRKSLGRSLAAFVTANGGTPVAALTSALRHPGQSLLRLRAQMPHPWD